MAKKRQAGSLEEEIPGRPGLGDAFGVADGAVVCVLDGAVVADMANRTVRRILDGAVRLDVPDGGVIRVLHGPVGAQMPHRAIAVVLYRAVGLDMADGTVTTVLNCAIGLYVGHRLIVGIGHPLPKGRRKGYHKKQYGMRICLIFYAYPDIA